MRIDQNYELFTDLRRRMMLLLGVMDNPYPAEDRIRSALGGGIKFADCCVVRNVLEEHRPKRCLEIGSFLGFSTRWLLESGAPWGMHVTAVDPNVRHRMFDNPRWMVEGLNARYYPDRLEIVSGFFGAHGVWTGDYEKYRPRRSRDWVEGLFASRREIGGGWGRRFDCIYIDADHSHAAVVDGFRNALPLLAPGGIMLFHDALTWEGVNRALRELRVEYEGLAEVDILDGSRIWEHPCLVGEAMRAVDGIGLFRDRGAVRALADGEQPTGAAVS